VRDKQIILIIDDETPFRNVLRRILEADHLVLEADSGEAGLQTARQEEPDLILLDIGLPDASGLDV
jgi:DNA-binding response OmpR family regulator